MNWIERAKHEASAYHINDCPKCGGSNVGICGDRTCGFETFNVRCRDCGHDGPWTPIVSASIREWNMRRSDGQA